MGACDAGVVTADERVDDRMLNGRRLTASVHEPTGREVVVFCHGVVAWVPDASVEEFVPSATGVIEEGGQLV